MGRIQNAFNGSTRVDFSAVKAASSSASQSLIERWLPGGRWRGDEYVVRNPTRADGKPGSFSINRRTCVWADFATGDRGGDLIDLYRFLNGGDVLDAARAIGDMLGVAETPATASIHTFPTTQRASTVMTIDEIQRNPERLPPRTTGPDAPKFFIAGDEGTRRYSDEKRRHFYLRGTAPVKLKIMRKVENDQDRDRSALTYFRVVDADGTEGWQSRKPEGWLDIPFIGSIDPFAPDNMDQTLYWPEGEKDAENMSARGFAAFTFGGTGDGLPDGCEEYVRGRNVVILADNDDGGRVHAQKKADLAAPIAASVKVIHFPELANKQDVSDWFEKGGTAEKLQQRVLGAPLVEAPVSTQPAPSALPRSLRIISAADFHGKPVPERSWHVPGIIPGRNVTLLQGDGATGKSLIALQLAAATVLGRTWLGFEQVEQGPVVYLSAEDEEPELHRRLNDISAEAGVYLRDMPALKIIPLAGEDAILAAPVARTNIIESTVLWRTIERAIAEIRPRLLVLDTLADLFAGEENQRAQARQFISMLRGAALKHDMAIVLLGHPSLEGLKSGSGTSGSTGWNNSVRSRLYFQRVFATENGKTIEPDEDVRELTVMKANYGRKGEAIKLRWSAGIFERQTGDTFGLNAVQRGAAAEDTFLTLLQTHEKLGLPVSPSPSALYAPTVFHNHSQANGVSKRAFKEAMERLLERGKIRIITEGPPSKKRSRITAYADG